MIEPFDKQICNIALELHFSTIPAQVAFHLLQRAQAQGYPHIAAFTEQHWRQAVEQSAQKEGQPSAQVVGNWQKWRASQAMAQQKADEVSALGAEVLQNLLIYGSQAYPVALYPLFRPPFVLFAQGNVELIHKDASGFAVCGSRKVTLQGRSDAFSVAYGVCQSGRFTLVSGLSEGIELAACEGALAADCPVIGVLCSGLHVVAPQESLQMAKRILSAGGLLLSEYAPMQPRQRYTFLQRNRILAAFSSSLIMAELGPKTKALNLVEYALELNHDVAVLGDSSGVARLREQGCPHWPDAAALLKALGLEYQVQMQDYPSNYNANRKPSHNIGEAVADSVYEELYNHQQRYLGRQVGKNDEN